MGNILFVGTVLSPEGNMLISNELVPKGQSRFSPSVVEQNDFQFIIRSCNGGTPDAFVVENSHLRPSDKSFQRDIYIEDKTPYTACFIFQGETYPNADATRDILREVKFGDGHTEYCLQQCYSHQGIDNLEASTETITVPTIQLTDTPRVGPTARIVNHKNIQFNPTAITTSNDCHEGEVLQLTRQDFNDDNQLFIIHFDGTIESKACPGLFLDVSGSNCANDNLILMSSNGKDNQKWRLEPSSTTVNSYGPVHTFHSLLCPKEKVRIQNDEIVFGGWGWDNQWHFYFEPYN